ncbi:hypothetical protein HRW12_00625 [Streptomyces lunaelactis]|uniref:hypothetical protein n=1 Tax=Streptomyces lunaelactis TaxID=1535768 RepID=UPI001584497A|nr:hypothetical protein [Streptomyces lunaelactis]NUK32302.1 hypothetical protein [Streptomyces lunaelactis]NUK41174.1 hypothetical protein [Streptomyces lunaelactis]
MPVPRLIAAVYVQDPTTREELILLPGECPDPEIAALVTNPDAWSLPPEDCEPELVAVGEPDPTAGKGVQESEQEEAGAGGGAKKPSPRRNRSAASS